MAQNITVPFILVPGPQGPSSLTTTTATFVQPAPGGTVNGVQVASTVALTQNGPVQVSNATTYFGTYLVTNVSLINGIGTVSLQWLSGGGGVAQNTTIPIGASLFPATLPGTGILGTQVVGTTTFREDGFDFVAGIAAGATSTVYTLPGSLLGNGEQALMSCAVQFHSNVAPQAIAGMTGNGVSPIVVQVNSTTGMFTGSVFNISGVLGNTAANGGWVITVIDGAHFSLNGSTGNGTWTASGVVQPEDFGHFERRGSFRNIGGLQIVNPQGTTTDTDVTAPAAPSNEGASLAGTLCAITPSNGTLTIQMTAPSATPIIAAGSVSYMRSPTPGAGPPPNLSGATLNVSHGPSQGGTTATPVTGIVTLSGATGLTGTFSLSLCGVPVASFNVVNDTTITFVPASERPFNLGTGNLALSTINGPGIMTNAWTYDADPYVILAAGVTAQIPRLWLRGDSLQFSGNNVTSWTDLSGNGNSLTTLVGVPTYEASSPNTNPGRAAMVTAGGTQGLINNSVTMGGAGLPVFAWGVFRTAGTGSNNGVILQLTNTNNMRIITASVGTTLSWSGNGGANAVWGTSIQRQLMAVWAYSQSGTGTETSAISVANATPVTATATGIALPSTEIVRFATDTLSFCDGEYFELSLANFIPSGTQLSQLEAYAQGYYGAP